MAEKKIILAIDDNIQQLNEYKNMLTGIYDLRVLKSASEAVNFLNRNKAEPSIDAILLDIEMPGISGFELLSEIKNIHGYMKTPIIIVSGNSDQEFLKRANESEVSCVLIKPVSQDRLIAAIEKAD